MRIPPWLLRIECAAALLAITIVGSPSNSGPQQQPGTAAESAAERVRVRVRFVDPAGAALPDVQVTWDPDQLESLDRNGPRAEHLGTSAPDGTCTFEVDARRRWMYAWTVAAGRRTTRLSLELEAGATADLGSVTLEPGGNIRGVVRDVGGHPLARARLVVLDTKENEPLLTEATDAGAFRETPRAFARSDENGAFVIQGAPVGSLSVWAHHESSYWQGRSGVVVTAAQETTGLTFALEPLPEDRILEGRVLDGDGRPIAGARVGTAVPDPSTRGQHTGSYAVQCDALTDDSGRFRIYLYFPAERVLSLHTMDPRGRFGEVHSKADPGAPDLEIRMPALRELTLVVLDMSAKPIEHYGWIAHVNRSSTFVRTNEAPAHHAGGRATLRLPESSFTLEMRAPGYDELVFGPYPPGAWPDPLEVRLPALPLARGTVSFEGRPVSGAFVELVSPDPHPFDGLVPDFELGTFYGFDDATTVTDSEGRFAIPSEFPHMPWHARAWKRGHGESKPVRIEIGGEPVALELRKATALAGTVRPATGVSPQELCIELRRTLRERGGSSPDETHRIRATPAVDGYYQLDSLAPGPWLLFVRRTSTQDDSTDAALPFVVDLKDEAQRFDVDLSEQAMYVLDGRLEVDGRAIRALVRLYAMGDPCLLVVEQFSDGDGRFRIAVRQPGTYRLAVQELRPRRPSLATGSARIALDVVELSRPITEWVRSVDSATWARGGVRFSFR